MDNLIVKQFQEKNVRIFDKKGNPGTLLRSSLTKVTCFNQEKEYYE